LTRQHGSSHRREVDAEKLGSIKNFIVPAIRRPEQRGLAHCAHANRFSRDTTPNGVHLIVSTHSPHSQIMITRCSPKFQKK
jgi:hypothetical protein